MVRAISVNQYLPSPINPSIRTAGLVAVLPALMPLLSQVIDLTNSQDLYTLPAHILTVMGIAVSAAQRTLIHRYQHGQATTSNSDQDRYQNTQNTVKGGKRGDKVWHGADDGVPFSEERVRSAETKLKDAGYVFAMPPGDDWDRMGDEGRNQAAANLMGGMTMGMGLGGMADMWDIDNWSGFWQSFIPDGGYTTDLVNQDGGFNVGVEGLLDLSGGSGGG